MQMLMVVEGKEERGPGMLLQGGTSPAGLSALKGTLMMSLPYHFKILILVQLWRMMMRKTRMMSPRNAGGGGEALGFQGRAEGRASKGLARTSPSHPQIGTSLIKTIFHCNFQMEKLIRKAG